MLRQVALSWDAHPNWELGRLLSSAASIARAQLRMNPREVSDRELASGLRALIPDDDE